MNRKKKQLSEYEDFRAYSIIEIATMLNIGKSKASLLLEKKILPVTKLGRQYFTSPQAIQDFLKKNIGKSYIC